MAQIGSVKIQTENSGDVSIPVFDTTDLHEDYVRVETSSGVGAIPIRDPSNAAYEWLRVHTRQGTKAIHNSTGLVIDNAEDGDVSEWSNPSSSGFNATNTAAYAGEFGIEVTGFESQISKSGLPRYPHVGDTFETYFQPRINDTNWIANIGWGVADSSTGPEILHRVRCNASDLYYQLVREGNIILSKQIPNVTSTDGNWYRILVDWNVGDTMDVTVEDVSGGTSGTVSTHNYAIREGGIKLYANGYCDIYSDEWIVLSESYNPAIDDFNSGDLSSWDADADASISQSERIEGTHGLHLPDGNYVVAASLPSDSPNYDSSVQSTTLPYYPSEGDEILFCQKVNAYGGTTEETESKFDFGCAQYDSWSSYTVQFLWENGSWRLVYDDENGNETLIAESSSLEVNTGTWYYYDLEWGSGGSFTVTQYSFDGTQIDTMSGSTSTGRAEGGLLLQSSTDTNVTYDNIRTLQRGAL